MRILEWKNLIIKYHEPLDPKNIHISVPIPAALMDYRLGLDKADFDEQTGILKFRGEETKIRRNSQQWKLVKFLYNSPNKIYDYSR